jgi:2-polyprenyl-3-methyl-5-hydroxy-6-metoxy-1,4-benzoquinol methylase
MKTSASQAEYWDRVASEKTFTHPCDLSLLPHTIRSGSDILDYGCGYGRILSFLADNGFVNLYGVDTSLELIKRAKAESAIENYHHIQSAKLPFPENSFDCITLFAILTCVPSSEDQGDIVREVARVLKPTGVVYLSDYLMQENKIDDGAYDEDGCFVTSEGAQFRHHTKQYLDALFENFTCLQSKHVTVRTLLGNDAIGYQAILARAVL